MKDKSLYKLTAIQYSDEFIEMVQKAKGNTEINEMIEKLNIESIEEVELPRSFEAMVHRSVDIKIEDYNNDELGDIRYNKEITVDWDELEDKLYNEFYDSKKFIVPLGGNKADYLTNEKMKMVKVPSYLSESVDDNYIDEIALHKAKLIIVLLKESWLIIERFFPVDKFGLPSKTILEALMGNLTNDQLIKRNYIPCIYENYDLYSLSLKMENDYLRKKLNQAGIDADKEMEEDGFNIKKLAMDEILIRNPKYSILINPSVNMKNITDNKNTLIFSIDTLNKEIEQYIFNTSHEIETMQNYAKQYAGLLLNEKLTSAQIYSKEYKDFDSKSQNSIERDVKKLIHACSLSDEIDKSDDMY